MVDIVKSIASPYVISVLENGEYEGHYYEVLPYFVNGDLEKAAPLDQRYIMEVVVPNVNEGLNALHSRGIIHRDITPNNIFFSNDKQHVVIGDFGISSVIDGVSVRMTSGSRTAGYSAPHPAWQA